MTHLFELASTHPLVAGIVLVVVCWIVIRYLTTGRKRKVSDYAKKFRPVDVSTAEPSWNTVKLSNVTEH